MRKEAVDEPVNDKLMFEVELFNALLHTELIFIKEDSSSCKTFISRGVSCLI